MSGIPVSDDQIDTFVEELLGIRTSDYEADKFLNEHLGPIDLRKDPRGIQLLYELPSFKQNFKVALEEELARLEENVLKLARGSTSDSIWAMLEPYAKGLSGKLKSQAHIFINPSVSVQDGSIDVTAQVLIYTGLRKAHGQVISDHGSWSGILRNLNSIPFGLFPDNGYHLRRSNNPESSYLPQRERTPNGIIVPSTHRVQATYVMRAAKEMFMKAYQMQTQRA